MNISVHTLLGKMEDELKEAQASGSQARVRERVHAIKSLCELLLEQEDNQAGAGVSYQQPIPMTSVPQIAPISTPIQATQTKKLQTDEGNGDSLFDF